MFKNKFNGNVVHSSAEDEIPTPLSRISHSEYNLSLTHKSFSPVNSNRGLYQIIQVSVNTVTQKIKATKYRPPFKTCLLSPKAIDETPPPRRRITKFTFVISSRKYREECRSKNEEEIKSKAI